MHKPLSLAELKSTRVPIRNANIAHREKLGRIDLFALFVTRHIGTMGFFLIIVLWTAGWLLWNTFAPLESRFDPFPAFVLWLFISNMIQIFLMPLIMIGQNLQARHSEARAEADFEVNLKAETEIENVLLYLENQEEMLKTILEKVEK